MKKLASIFLLNGLAFSNSHWKEVREIYTMPLRLPLASCSSSDRLHNGCTGNHTSGSSHWWLWWPLGKRPCRVGQSGCCCWGWWGLHRSRSCRSWPCRCKSSGPCRAGVNFINILQAAFATKLICQKNSKPNYN